MRELDRLTTEECGVPSFALMQAAANACFLEIEKKYSGKTDQLRVRILCGPGNNGGDGAALAQMLSAAGTEIEVILFGKVDNTSGHARTNFDRVQELAKDRHNSLTFIECSTSEEWKHLSVASCSYNVIVDALFGTGLSRPLKGIFAEVVQDLQVIIDSEKAPFILSVDIPSGLNSDSSLFIGPTVEADLTVTFTAPKIANVLPPASHANGKLAIAEIGSPTDLLERIATDLFITEQQDAQHWLIKTRYARDSFKNTHGHVLVIAGSRDYTGAAVLCGNAAMRAGAGLTTVATPNSAQTTIAASVMPEVITTALGETDRGAVSDTAIDYVSQLSLNATVVAIGPGLTSEDERTRNFVHAVVDQRRTPVVIDADALNCLAPWPDTLSGDSEFPIVLTPHPGEMLRLLGADDKTMLEDRVGLARTFAVKNHVILVLKGAPTVIAAADGRVFINPTGNPGLGTAGAGDTLTGLVAGFLSQEFAQTKHKADALQATIAALYVGGFAGDLAARELGMRSMMASDIRERIGDAICLLDPVGEGCSE